MATVHWISTKMWTVEVKVDDKAKIVWTAPLVRRFLGQPIGYLLNWAIPFGGLRHQSWPAPKRKVSL